MLVVIAIIHITCRYAKLKALLMGIAFQPVKQAEAVITNQTKQYCTAQWYAIACIDYDDNITYCLHLPNHLKMYYI